MTHRGPRQHRMPAPRRPAAESGSPIAGHPLHDQEAQSRKRCGHADTTSPLRTAHAPSPDAHYGHPALRSLHAGYASPSWLRLPPSPAPGHRQPLARHHDASHAHPTTHTTPHPTSPERERGDHGWKHDEAASTAPERGVCSRLIPRLTALDLCGSPASRPAVRPWVLPAGVPLPLLPAVNGPVENLAHHDQPAERGRVAKRRGEFVGGGGSAG